MKLVTAALNKKHSELGIGCMGAWVKQLIDVATYKLKNSCSLYKRGENTDCSIITDQSDV